METTKVSPLTPPLAPVHTKWLRPEMEPRLFRERLGDRLPFIIGVSGHIDADPQSLAAIEDDLRKQLLAWRAALPSTPFILFSSMARGADWFAARLVKDSGIDAQLVVPLPLPWELYRADFPQAEADDLEKFLVSSEAASFELPLLPGVTKDEVSHKGPARDNQYALAGAFVARNCHVLLALWDEGIGKTGGTADVVGYKLEGVPEKFLRVLGADDQAQSADGLELGPVYHFPVERIGAEKRGEKKKARVLFPRSYDYESADEAEKYFQERIFRPVEGFNSRTISAGAKPAGLLPPEVFAKTVPWELKECLAYLERLSDRADQLAINNAGHTRRTLLWMSLFVGLAALCFDISGDLAKFSSTHHYVSWSMLGFPIFFIAAFVLHLIASGRQYQDRHQDYRALAEGLRVQFFWQLAGVPDSVASHYLGQQRPELYWIRRACAGARMFLPRHGQPLNRARADAVRTYWMDHQYGYFFKKAGGEEESLEWLELLKSALFMFSVGAILLVALFEFEPVREYVPGNLRRIADGLGDHESRIHIFFTLLAVIAGVLAALLHNYANKLALSYHVKQYQRMERIFRLSIGRYTALVDTQRFAEAQREIRSLGGAALIENGDWVLAHRDRPLEVPHH